MDGKLKRVVLITMTLLMTAVMGADVSFHNNSSKRSSKDVVNEAVVNGAIREKYGEEVTAIQPDKTIEEGANDFLANYIWKDNDGLIIIDKQLYDDKESLSFICDEEDEIQFDAYVDFVETNIELSNSFIENGLGTFDENGDFIPNVESEGEYTQQEFAITNFNYTWYSGWRFTLSDTLTSIAGWAGVLAGVVNLLSVTNLSKFGKLNGSSAPSGLYETCKSLFGKILDNPDKVAKFFTKIVSNSYPEETLIAAVWGGITIASAFLSSNPWGWIAKVILTVLSLYLPSTVRGLFMGIEGIQGHSSNVNIGYWWSTYEIV